MTTLAEMAGMVAGYRQLELDVFALLCRWSGQTPEPELKMLLREHGRVHGEHALAWESLLPTLEPQPARPHGLVAAMAGREGSAQRMAAVYQDLLPALIDEYGQREARLSAVSAAPITRALARMVDDDADQVAAGERLRCALFGRGESAGGDAKEELGARPSNQSGTRLTPPVS